LKSGSVIDLTASDPKSISHFENPIYPDRTREVGILSISASLSSTSVWRPKVTFPIRRDLHPLERLLPADLAHILTPATNQRLNDVIFYPTQNRIQNVRTKHMQELLTHGSMTSDSIINTFLYIL